MNLPQNDFPADAVNAAANASGLTPHIVRLLAAEDADDLSAVAQTVAAALAGHRAR